MLFGLCFSVCGLARGNRSSYASCFLHSATTTACTQAVRAQYTPEDFTLKIDIEACKLAAKTIVIYGNAGTGNTQWTLTQFKHPLLVNHVDDLKEIVPGAVASVATVLCSVVIVVGFVCLQPLPDRCAPQRCCAALPGGGSGHSILVSEEECASEKGYDSTSE